MPKQTVPEIGNSTGMKGFPTLEPGAYGLAILNCKVSEDDNEPADNWQFNCLIKYGPPLANGKPSVGQRFSPRVKVLRRENPDFEEKFEFGVDQLKSWADAAGVPVEKNGVNNDLFAGMEVEVDLSKTQSKTDKERFFNNIRAIRPIGEGPKAAKGAKVAKAVKAEKAPGAKRGRKPKSIDPIEE